MSDFRELKVWHKAHELTLDFYRATKSFPKEELYGLTSQIRPAAASIGANIAEESGKSSRPDLARFLQIALGWASRLRKKCFPVGSLTPAAKADAENGPVIAVLKHCATRSQARDRVFPQPASELEYHLLLSRDLGYLVSEIFKQLSEQVVETKKILRGFINTLDSVRQELKAEG